MGPTPLTCAGSVTGLPARWDAQKPAILEASLMDYAATPRMGVNAKREDGRLKAVCSQD